MITDYDFKHIKEVNLTEMICHQGFWYVATPFAKLCRKDAMEIAAISVFKLLEKKIYCLSPILHTSSINDHCHFSNRDLHWSHSDFLQYDGSLLAGSCGLVLVDVPESRYSLGMYGEYCYAKSTHKPIYKLDLNKNIK